MGKTTAVIVAAGKGSRMKAAVSKQYLPLAGKPILAHTLEVFQQTDVIDAIVLVVGEEDIGRCEQLAQQSGISKLAAIVAGGGERQDSVYKGLLQLPEKTEWVLVHDGARPLVSREAIARCWQKAKQTGAAVLAVPVKDTIKVVGEAGEITATPDRNSLWAIQTPQAFRASLLVRAYREAEQSGFRGTDDAMLAEQIGCSVLVADGEYSNIKITTPEDLWWAEACYSARQGR